MKIPKIQWLELGESFTKKELRDMKEENWQSFEGRFLIHGLNEPGFPPTFTLTIREIRYGLKDEATVRITKLGFPSVKAAKKFAQRRLESFSKGQFDQADLAVADLQELYEVPEHQRCRLEDM